MHHRPLIHRYDDLDADFLTAIFNEASKIASDVMLPVLRVGDELGRTLENGVVRTPLGSKKLMPS